MTRAMYKESKHQPAENHATTVDDYASEFDQDGSATVSNTTPNDPPSLAFDVESATGSVSLSALESASVIAEFVLDDLVAAGQAVDVQREARAQPFEPGLFSQLSGYNLDLHNVIDNHSRPEEAARRPLDSWLNDISDGYILRLNHFFIYTEAGARRCD